MKILLAVDDSPHSQRAVEFTAQMRWPAGSRVLVASVMAPPMPVSAALDAPTVAEPMRVHHEDRRAHEQMLERVRDRLRSVGFPVETHLLEGDPREKLLELTERELVNLLILGSHGRTGIARLLLGSVSSHAVSHAPCSVLVVKAA